MKTKALALSAMILASSFGFTGVTHAAAFSPDAQILQIENQVETQQLSRKVRNRNKIIAGVIGAVVIGSIINNNNKRDRVSDDYYEEDRGYDEAPPPPPMPAGRR